MTPNNISAGRESQLQSLDEDYNYDREERYEIDSDDERRYRENCDAEDEQQRYQDEQDAARTRARSSRISEFEEDWDHHNNFRWWGSDDEDEEGMAAEGGTTE